IRERNVTGVQTYALPICIGTRARGGELCWNDGGIGDECGYFSSIGPYQQLFGRGNLRDATFLQHHDAVCDGEGFIAIMGDVDCGDRKSTRLNSSHVSSSY